MPTLHIEHAISDFPTWKAAFDRFGDARVAAGVRRHTVRQPTDDVHHVVIDLDFDTVSAAQGFLDVLRNRVWSTRESSPALVGSPEAKILEVVDHHEV